MLTTLVVLLAAATIAVPLTRRAGFGSVLGYLLAGIVIGPAGLRLVTDVDAIASIASLGVVMLLFLIGLEVRPQRLWVMRRSVFGLGTAQVAISGAALAALAHTAGIGWPGAIVLGAGLAMSSTAIVLPMLAERDLLTSPAGRDTFAVLLFQDLAFIPLVALVPLLGGDSIPDHVPWHDVARAAVAIAVILIGGRFLMRPLFRAIGGAKTPEVFTAVALLIVAGTALLATAGGLSPSLGAFMAGVLLSESEYRHELQADIAPFEGLLLGFFFISVGMSADLHLASTQPALLAAATVSLLVAKSVIGFGLARIGGQDTTNALRFGLALPQASEFSFVLFGAAVAAGALGQGDAAFATLVTAASMVATPILFAASEAFVIPRLKRAPAPEYDTIDADPNPVIICRLRPLRADRRPRPAHARHRVHGVGTQPRPGRRRPPLRQQGVFRRSDARRRSACRRRRAGEAAGDDAGRSAGGAANGRSRASAPFRTSPSSARARNRWYAHLLMDRDVDGQVRETFYSSLHLARMALTTLGIDEEAAERAVALFRDRDEKTLLETHAVYRDEKQVIQSQQQAAEELASLFAADKP